MRYFGIILACILVWGCDDESIIPPATVDISEGDVLVVNEGGFQRGNATIGLYNTHQNTYEDKVFLSKNQIPVGDVLQQIASFNKEYWLVLNNSGKVIVVDSTDLSVKQEIKGLTSPRFVVFNPSLNRAYISDLYADEITVVNTSNYQVINHISMDGWTDHMVITNDELYVANREKPYVYVVDATTETITDSIEIANNPNSLVLLRSGKLAALCEGKLGSNEGSKLEIIDVKSKSVTKTLEFDAGIKPSLLRESPVNGNLYCAFKGIHYVDPVNYTYKEKLIDLPSANIYGFDIDPVTGNWFVADAKDYVLPSEVYVYKNASELKHKFTAGVICNGFVFR